jgi:DNA-binding XRE family transcriptional regulator
VASNSIGVPIEAQRRIAQEEVAAILGVTRQTISNWEKGEDTTIAKFCNSCNPRDQRMKLTQKQKQEEVAAIIGVTQKTVSNWEKGEDITIGKFTNGL